MSKGIDEISFLISQATVFNFSVFNGLLNEAPYQLVYSV